MSMKETNHRRNFLKSTVTLGTVTALSGLVIFPGCSRKGEEQEVSPPEDLMQEHGLLNRVLLIYDCCRISIVNKKSFPETTLFDAATIIRTFVEDYHEKQEEN